MQEYAITIRGLSRYGQGRYHGTPKKDKEQAHDYEHRTWRARQHVDERGQVFIPPMALKNCLSEAAKFLGMQIKGKGKSTYTKHFEAGLMITQPAMLFDAAGDPIMGCNTDKEVLFVPSSGVRGDGKRVEKVFPIVASGWTTSTSIQVLDDTITEAVLYEHLVQAGSLIGIGRFRPRNNGYYGRFVVTAFEAAAGAEAAE